MAEAVIVSIAGEIVASLVPQELEKVGKLWGVKHELKALKDTVSMLQPVLEHAEEQYHQIPHIRVWVEKLKDAFYEAQDVLEEFNIEAMRQELRGHNEMIKEVRTFFSSSNQLAFKRKMSSKVRAVRERIEAIKADKGIHLDERPVGLEVERERRKRRETHSFIPKGDVIGRDEDKKMISEFLMDPDVKEPISILPIVGIEGLGKTALAQFMYNDEMVGDQFELKMWVCVSDDFDMTKIVKNIITCAKNKKPTEDVMEQLQSELRAEIDGKKYLLVLDDVWNAQQERWLELKNLLVGGARGSKILITTRLSSVAKITGTAPPYFLGSLSKSASLDLLMQMAGQKKEEIQDPEMLAIATEIAGKCSGVPLVVRTVGGLLYSKESKHEWSQFKDEELPEVFQSEDNIKSVLKLSYNHLPSHLKQCFAFCSLFPKDYEIKKKTLVDLWVAEGFISPSKKSQHLEDIAHKYFMDLLGSNFFQDFKKDPSRNEETCKMHDLMHDLACLVAGTECWVPWDDTKSIHERTRHISMGDLPILRWKASPLRTFLSAMPQERSEADLHQLIQSFKRLRILDLHATHVNKVPRSICKLKYLTYLDLSHNYALKRLPNSITRLQSLQTLILDDCAHLEELPRDIRKLVSLRNLDINGCKELRYVPCGLEHFSSLQRLTRFILPREKALAKNYCRLGELNGLNNIRGSLCIENLGSITNVMVESTAANLIEKHSLEFLALKWGDFGTGDAVIGDRNEALLVGLRPHSNLQKLMIHEYKGENFPGWMTSLRNLVELSLQQCRRCKHLPPLGQLPDLKSLDICSLTELEYIDSDNSLTASFPSLLKLKIVDCEKLTVMPLTLHLEELTLRKANSALINQIFGLNKLKSLVIWEMEFLECLPGEGLKNLTSLESLFIRGCPRLTFLSLGLRYLSNLVDLSISFCGVLDLCKNESGNILDFQGLQNLQSVDISYLPKLASLPQWLFQANNLKRLKIYDCDNLEALPEDGLKTLNSLEYLEIGGCPRLNSLSLGIRHLSNLVHVAILTCEDLDLSKDESSNILDFQGLQSLRNAKISLLPKLEYLPQWLLRASNLERLRISHCDNLKAIPEQIEALQSLQKLEIIYCPLLTTLPEGIQRLASLSHLNIAGCPELEERCIKDAGEDWYKIANIPHISHQIRGFN